MEIRAEAKYIRMSPKKIRLVVETVRGLPLEKTINVLSFSPRRAAKPVLKVINSAIANAEHNFNFKKDDLFIKSLVVNEGPALKRWMPKARGAATPIKRRGSHILVVLGTKKDKISAKAKTAAKAVSETFTPPQKEMVQPVLTQEMPEKEMKKRLGEIKPEVFDRTRLATDRRQQHLDRVRLKRKGGFLKKVFRRKAI